MQENPRIEWSDFSKVELRVGRILSAQPLPKARQPAFVLQIDFGAAIGIKKSSAQITQHYTPEALIGKLVVAVTNFPPKQVGSIMSECLVTGFHDENGAVRLCVPDGEIPLGTRLA
jgi:tRNA-binding protein